MNKEGDMQHAKVLLVDDEKPYINTMLKRLSKRGLKVISAYDGLEALETLEKDRTVDVVILDIKMPLVEVIMLTGHATVETGIEGMKMGACDYLMKPCDTEELVAKVQEAVARKRRQENKIMEARIQTITLRKP